jgi:hypothetical protein
MSLVEENSSWNEPTSSTDHLSNVEKKPAGFTDEMMETEHPLNQLVYLPDAKDGYALGRIVDLDTKHLIVRLEAPRSGEVEAKYSDVVPAVEDQEKDVNDNCKFSAEFYINTSHV